MTIASTNMTGLTPMLAKIDNAITLVAVYAFMGVLGVMLVMSLPHLLYWTWEIIVFFVQNYLAWILSYMGY